MMPGSEASALGTAGSFFGTGLGTAGSFFDAGSSRGIINTAGALPHVLLKGPAGSVLLGFGGAGSDGGSSVLHA